MRRARTWTWLCVSLFLTTAMVTGCGTQMPSGSGAVSTTDSQPAALPMMAMGAPGGRPQTAAPPASNDDADDDDSTEADDEKDDATGFVIPKNGTPEWLVHEATKLLLEPPPKTEDVEVLKKHRHDRNEKIVKLSKLAIAQTHGDVEKVRLFNVAV